MRIQLRHIVPLALLWLGCGVETPASQTPAAETEQVAQLGSMLQASACDACLAGTEGARFLGGFERRQVADDIFHYSIPLRVGPGEHDVIVLHRVVREVAPWVPARAPESLFMVHGDAWDFTGAFLSNTLTSAVPMDRSIVVYLARRGVDVWGIDLRWTQVAADTQDFRFMKSWNLGTHAQDVGTGLRVARALRRATGNGYGKMNLLGWSRGAMVSYAYLNAETQLPPGLRNVSGFIPVDMVMHFGPEAEQQRQWACTRAAAGEAVLKSGRYEGNLSGPGAGVAILQVGAAALAWPNVVAQPPLPPLSFHSLALTLGAATFSFLESPAQGIHAAVPSYHFAAGQFGADGMASGLQYVNEQQFFTFLGLAHPYQSFTEQVETDELMCGQSRLPYDGHLSEVKVPVLYVGAGGGFGGYGVYSAKLLGSKDLTVHLVQRQPTEARVLDYGHVDLFQGSDAETAVWAPIYEWMMRH